MGDEAVIHLPDERLAVTAVRGPQRLDDLLFQAKKASRLAPLQLLRADRVVGIDHVRQAARLTWRAIAEGRQRAERVEVEFTRYVAGKRTIKEALAHMGLEDDAPGAVVVGLGEQAAKAVEYFVEMLGLEEDDTLLQADPEKLRAFGISDEMLAATTPARHMDLVLEAVAAVDLLRS